MKSVSGLILESVLKKDHAFDQNETCFAMTRKVHIKKIVVDSWTFIANEQIFFLSS